MLNRHLQQSKIDELSVLNKDDLLDSEKALLNMLDVYSVEIKESENTQKALLNILDDYNTEKINMENTQKAMLNILDDYREEKQKVDAINNDLLIANKELTQFAYVASHDLQEPLQTIANFVGMVREIYADKTDKESEQYFKFIIDATSRMQLLIKHLLDFSRVGRNLSLQMVDCNKIVKNVISELDNSIKEKKASVSFSGLPSVFGDPVELKQLFQNLISNAIKFHRKDVNPEVLISAEEKINEFVFAVKDNGIGIEEKYHERLFIIFQRLHSATEYPGTGIGLATCKKIVTLHNGKIWVESKLNEGSTFYFTIPKKTENEIKSKLPV